MYPLSLEGVTSFGIFRSINSKNLPGNSGDVTRRYGVVILDTPYIYSKRKGGVVRSLFRRVY